MIRTGNVWREGRPRAVVSLKEAEGERVGGATENAGVENAGADNRGGKCRSKRKLLFLSSIFKTAVA